MNTGRMVSSTVLVSCLISPLHAQTGTGPERTTAREVAQQHLGRPVADSEILERLRLSGLSQGQARQRLRQAGYDPTILDPYFAQLNAGDPPNENSETGIGDALRALGIADPSAPEAAAAEADLPTDDARAADAGTDSAGSLQVFGRSIFRSATNRFQPASAGPVDESYRLGPGDQIQLVLTGDVEAWYTADVSREGAVTLPDVGRIPVLGTTLGAFRATMRDRLGAVYSTIHSGTTQFEIVLSRLRNIQVFVIGEVEVPGAYQTSALSTVFNALYMAGGPSELGSFRRIQLRRSDRVVAEIDLYEYLLVGNTAHDVRLEQGDILYVPMAGPRVWLEGTVRRPSIYEFRGNEGLREIVGFAGGLSADASDQRFQIDRILTPEHRSPGRERVLIDVRVWEISPDAAGVPLQDGDRIRAFAISDQKYNQVTIGGEVVRPGTYEFVQGLTVGGLISRADGLLPDAYQAVAHIFRLDPVNGTQQLQRLPLQRDTNGSLLHDVPLRDLDQVVIYSRAEMINARIVEVEGPVKRPGEYAFADGMMLNDLILAAGGMQSDFLAERAHVSRLGDDFTRSMIQFELKPDSVGIPTRQVPLKPHDRVRIFSKQELVLPRVVQVHGAVRNSGTYPFETGMSVMDLLLSAGGFAAGAEQMEVEVARRRSGTLRSDSVATIHRVTLPAGSNGYRGAGSEDDGAAFNWLPSTSEFRLEEGDHVFVRRQPGYSETETVSVSGRVVYPGAYALELRRENISDLVRRAGGLRPDAHINGARLIRAGIPVALNLRRATRNPGSSADLPLFPGDELIVPEYDPTVLVTGAVAFEARVAYKRGADLSYYLAQAGGMSEDADKRRIVVTHQNGRREISDGFWFLRSQPGVLPGSTVLVPVREPGSAEGFNLDKLLTRTVGLLSTAATIVIAADRIAR